VITLDRLAEVSFGGGLEVAQNHRGELGRGVLLVAHLDLDKLLGPAGDAVRNDLLFMADLVVPPTHEAFDGIDGVLRVGDLLVLGTGSDQPLTLLGERDHRRRQARPLLVDQDFGLSGFHDGDNRVGGTQVDPDDF